MRKLCITGILFCLCARALAGGINEPVVTASIGPEGGVSLSLVADNQNHGTLYAGARHAGVFKTTDGGANWSYSGLAGFTVTALAIDPQDPTSVYAGAFTENDEGDPSNPRIFKSTDAGKSWSSTSDSGFPIACVVGGLVTDHQNPGTVYAYTGCDGVFRSDDKAETWQPVNFGLPERGAGRFVGALAIDPQNSILYVVAFRCDQSGKLPPPACDSRVFRSVNRGDAWSEATSAALTGSMFQSMVIDPGNPNTLYAKVLVPNMQNEVVKSNDGGKSWSPANLQLGTGCCVSVLTIDPQGTLYAAGLAGLFKSADAGASWSVLSFFQGPTGLSTLTVDPQNPNTIYAADDRGIFKTTDGGASWSAATSGFRATPVLSMAIDPRSLDTLYAGTAQGAFKSIDGGKSWAVINSGINVPYTLIVTLAIDPQNPNNLFAGTEGDNCGGVFRSVNAGTSWANTGLVNCISAVMIDPQNPSTVYAATLYRGVLKSTDGGGSWTEINSGLVGDYVTALTLDPQNPTILYAGVQSPAGLPGVRSTLLKSTDGGMTWNSTALSVAKSFISEIALDPQNPGTFYAVTATSFPGAAGGLWKSTDGGTSWRDLSPSLPSPVYALAVSPRNPATIYAGTDVGVMTSTDAGESWAPAPLTLNIGPTHFLVLDPKNQNTLYAGGPGGLFEIALSTITAIGFDVTVVKIGASYTATIVGSNLNSDIYFDVQVRAPGSAADIVVLNWQTGTFASHPIVVGVVTGTWAIHGLRAHQNSENHAGSFVPVSGNDNGFSVNLICCF